MMDRFFRLNFLESRNNFINTCSSSYSNANIDYCYNDGIN